MTKYVYSLLLLFLTASLGLSQTRTSLEAKLYADIQDYRLDDFDHIDAAFILSGANDPDSLRKYRNWYNDLLSTIQGYYIDMFDRVGSASKVFSYLHGTWLLTYKEQATTLIDVIKEKRYNCVAGTILYNLVCQDLGFPTEAFETPTHTYTIFTDFNQRIMVENTSPMGFDIMQNLRQYSEYLLQFYPQEQRYKIGLDRIYAYENSKGRTIDNTELLGLLAYNRAYFANQTGDYKKAYDFVQLAQRFNRDSRSNVNFEIGLYYRWGKKLIDEGNVHAAFSVFADAYYRYWDNPDFAHNCKVAFHQAQQKNWYEKDWDRFQRTMNEMLDLDILSGEELDDLRPFITSWLNYFRRSQEPIGYQSAINYFQRIYPNDPHLNELER